MINRHRPSIPIRKIVGVILLKRTYNESDESVVDRWKENLYWQHFCGEVNFQHEWLFDPTELFKFRKRMGERGMERILRLSIDLFEEGGHRVATELQAYPEAADDRSVF